LDGFEKEGSCVVGPRDIAGFAAIGAIVETIQGEADVELDFTDAAVLVADTSLLSFVALGAKNLLATGHMLLREECT
jgi:hypothetical protein